MTDDDGKKRDLGLRRGGLILGAAVIVAIGLVALGAAAGTRLMDKDPPPPTTQPAASSPATPISPSPSVAPTPAGIPDDFTRFRDKEVGFSIAYPKGWNRLEPGDPQVRLVVAGGENESILVRATRVGFTVGQGDLGAVKTLTDKIVRAGEGIDVLAGPTEIELGALPGYFYFYSFKDGVSGKRGAHSHYFLFEGKKMISIVFQTIPLERFPQVAPLFDRIAQTFRG